MRGREQARGSPGWRREQVKAVLLKDDYVVFEGIKITVVESGDFGDVIKVEKV